MNKEQKKEDSSWEELEETIDDIEGCFEGNAISFHAGKVRTILINLLQKAREELAQELMEKVAGKIQYMKCAGYEIDYEMEDSIKSIISTYLTSKAK